MEKYPFIIMILITLLLISLIVNSVLLYLILMYNRFLLSDIITVNSILLLIFAIIGVIMKKKWGTALIFVKSIFNIVLCFIYLSIGITGTLLIIVIIIILASKEYLHVDFY